MSRMQITGIVLAGGKSSRMGTDKCKLKLGGKTLTEIALNKLQTICNEVVISSNSHDFDHLGVKIIPDLITGCGPLAGIYSAIKETNAENYLVLPADLPFIPVGFLQMLTQSSGNFDVVVPRNNEGFIEPLAAYYSRRSLQVVEDSLLSSDFSVYKIFSKLNAQYIDWENLQFPNIENIFMNLNSPEDYRKAAEIIGMWRDGIEFLMYNLMIFYI